MDADSLGFLALMVAVVPVFMPSSRSFGIAIVFGLVALTLLGKAILAVPKIGYGPTLAGGIVVASSVALFLFACVLRGVLLALKARRLALAAIEERSKPTRPSGRSRR